MVKHKHSSDNCTACTTCTAYCPVATVTKKFKGPKMTGPAFERFRLLNQVEDESLAYCSNCKTCDISCPSNVPISTLNMLARAEYFKTHRPPLRDWFVSHGEKLAKWTELIPAWMKNMGMNNPITRYILDVIGIHKKAPLPNFAPKTFRQLFEKMPKKPSPLNKKVVFFPGCFVNIYAPQIGVDLVEVLQAGGYEVIVPDFICCGLPLISNGFAYEAEKNAIHNTKELAKWAEQGIRVLATCPSCSLMLKREYKDLYPSISDMGLRSDYISDACEFVIEMMENGEIKTDFTDEKISTVYHAPCHQRAQGMGRTGYYLAKMIPGVEASDPDKGCCGISGSYGFKKDKYDISMAIGEGIFNAVAEAAPDYVITECGTCQVQIKHGTGVEAIHPVSLLKKKLKPV